MNVYRSVVGRLMCGLLHNKQQGVVRGGISCGKTDDKSVWTVRITLIQRCLRGNRQDICIKLYPVSETVCIEGKSYLHPLTLTNSSKTPLPLCKNDLGLISVTGTYS